MSDGFRFLKGHGTENDFVVLPDPDGTIHGELSAALVRRLCDRRSGIGADGVLRAVRDHKPGAEWFMDYRNADGSTSEMCGNGIRVFVRYLVDYEGVDPAQPVAIGTRAGVQTVTVDGDLVTASLSGGRILGDTKIEANGHRWPAVHVTMGNPHAVVFVDGLEAPGALASPPVHDRDTYPDGVNVEFVVRRGERHLQMRVHERGSGETRSCGTGACAAAVAAAAADRAQSGSTYRVDVPGGTLHVTPHGDRVLLAGPAVLVAEGQYLGPPA